MRDPRAATGILRTGGSVLQGGEDSPLAPQEQQGGITVQDDVHLHHGNDTIQQPSTPCRSPTPLAHPGATVRDEQDGCPGNPSP